MLLAVARIQPEPRQYRLGRLGNAETEKSVALLAQRVFQLDGDASRLAAIVDFCNQFPHGTRAVFWSAVFPICVNRIGDLVAAEHPSSGCQQEKECSGLRWGKVNEAVANLKAVRHRLRPALPSTHLDAVARVFRP